MSLPSWVDPVARYVLETGLKNTLRMAGLAVLGSAVVGVVLGTLLTIRFWPSRALIRLYLRFWRLVGLSFGMAQGAAQFCRRDAFSAGTMDEMVDVMNATRKAVVITPDCIMICSR